MGREVLLFNETTAGLWLRAANLTNKPASFGAPIRVADHRSGQGGGIILVEDDSVHIPMGGAYTPAILRAPIMALRQHAAGTTNAGGRE
jgi:hypothetical protein